MESIEKLLEKIKKHTTTKELISVLSYGIKHSEWNLLNTKMKGKEVWEIVKEGGSVTFGNRDEKGELTLIPFTYLLNISTAAIVSRVGVSPQHAIIISGSHPSSLLAHFHILMPSVQCLTASSILNHCGLGCLEATITFT